MTHEDSVENLRVRLVEYAAKINNVAEACRVSDVSRKTSYQWLGKAEKYGLSALLPKARRRPHQPYAMSSEQVAVILAEAVTRPTLRARALLRHLKARGGRGSASGVAKVLHRHGLGTGSASSPPATTRATTKLARTAATSSQPVLTPQSRGVPHPLRWAADSAGLQVAYGLILPGVTLAGR